MFETSVRNLGLRQSAVASGSSDHKASQNGPADLFHRGDAFHEAHTCRHAWTQKAVVYLAGGHQGEFLVT